MQKKIKKWLKSNLLVLIGGVVGSVVGYLYWTQTACENGTCLITAHPLNTIIYGAVFGGLFFSLFTNLQKTKK